jgi:galactokinase
VSPRRCTAFAPGRVNVIGEHTDYNQGLALPFAIADGVMVRASAIDSSQPEPLLEAFAADLDEHDSFPLRDPGRAAPGGGWRAYVRGAAAELAAAGRPLVPARLEISGSVAHGAGLSSSAALTVALCLAMSELGAGSGTDDPAPLDRIELARLASRVENEWAGAHTGLLDQLASLFGAADSAICIDFQSLDVQPVPLALEGWRFVIADSGERHAHASSGYNERRRECAAACEALGIASLREASLEQVARLPEPLERRARHVLEENDRVLDAVDALRAGAVAELAELLNASHASLRDLYQVSTPAVEATVEKLLRAGAVGARLIGGGFGGSVLGLLEPGVALPRDSIEVTPGPGAHILAR